MNGFDQARAVEKLGIDKFGLSFTKSLWGGMSLLIRVRWRHLCSRLPVT